MVSPEKSHTATVLVVDDDSMLRFLARETLEQSGFRVEEVDDGIKALEAFVRLKPDIILMDVMMPGKDGYAACAEIREHPGGDEIQVLMMTGLDDYESIKKAFDVGSTDFITKPINWGILGYRVRYMLRAKHAIDNLRKNETRFLDIQRLGRIGCWEWNIERNEFYCSEEMYRIFTVDVLGFDATYESYLNAVHPLDMEYVASSMDEALHRRLPFNIDHRIILPDGTEKTVHAEAEVTFAKDDKPVWMAGIMQDITERKQAEAQIYNLAYFDSLTGLPNRLLFKEHLGYVLARTERCGQMAAILFLDLDRFKNINDTLGHGLGDKLLQGVAERLQVCVRKSDVVGREEGGDLISSVARQGGDEFIVLLTEINNVQDAARVSQRIINSVSQPFLLGSHEVTVTTSIGISLFPNDGNDIVTLIKNADTAMYYAKDLGRNNFQFYTRSMNASTLERLALENHLRKAVERNEFLLHFQPQIDVVSSQVVGVEALVRWKHPEMGMVSPGEFIPLAEETGLIIQIDEWVLRTACMQAVEWIGSGLPPITMSVNLSGQHFIRARLLDTVASTLRDSGLDPGLLELELTEGVLMKNAEETVSTLKALKEMGVHLSIDDFGTGYSSLSYLRRFPLDTLKIDRSFVKDVTTDADSAAITKAIIAMAHSLKLKVLAEGVETEEQMAYLRDHDCQVVQGFLYSRPLPYDELVRFFCGRRAA